MKQNQKLLYVPTEVDFHKDWGHAIDQNFKQMENIDLLQKEKGMILYRYVDFPYADGKSYYQVVEINKNQATLKLITGLGDDYSIFGEQCDISLEEVKSCIQRRDSFDALWKNRKKK